MQGRSRQLHTNYRNTEQIQRLAETVLTAPSVGGDGEEESRHSVSLLTGEEPLLKVCATSQMRFSVWESGFRI
jgi:hypothetical protein